MWLIGYFHNFYERQMLHNIERHVRLIKESCPFLVQNLFFGWIQSLRQWNLSKGSNVVICGSIRTLCVVYRRVKVQVPSIWDVETNYPSTQRFGVSMAKSCVHPSIANHVTIKCFSIIARLVTELKIFNRLKVYNN
jgi:hypothetical protein